MPVNDCAIVTLISGGGGYLQGARALKMALNDHMPEYTHAIMVEEGAYPNKTLNELEARGYLVHPVPPIRSKQCDFAAERWPKTFTKINLWSLPYDKIVYYDADACSFAPFPELFGIEKRIAATHTAKKDLKRFRSGMMVIEPDPVVYKEIVDLTTNAHPKDNGARLGDQGVLNIYFGKDFTTLPYKYNYCEWAVKPQDEVIIGHLRPTPWSGRQARAAMRPYVDRWTQYRNRW